MKGFDDWMEIFRGGRQVDNNGQEHDGDQIIARALASFDAAEHEPPIVVGHPADNAPAFGWVEKLKAEDRNGKRILLAKTRQVVPEFADLVKKGLYKKRSASFYPDGRLRHVGFLGAAPPAVKGLADLKFSDREGAVFEFGEAPWVWGSLGRVLRRLRDWIVEKEGVEAADRLIPEWDIEDIKEQETRARNDDQGKLPAETNYSDKGGTMEFKEKLKNMLGFMGIDVAKVPDDAYPSGESGASAPRSFSEADIEAVRREEREKATAEFAEKENARLREARKKEVSDWCDAKVAAGKIAPAWVKAGIKEFCQRLDAEGVVEFSEGQKETALKWFQDFVEGLPKLIDFSEIATRDGAGPAGDAGQKLEALTARKMKEKPDMTYAAAFSEVQAENPDLATEYSQNIGG